MNKRFPRYPDDADYQTNSPSYYEDLARKHKLIQLLAEKIWDYDKRLDDRLEDLENVLQDYLSQWDERIENLDDEVSHIFITWLEDGTLEKIINHDVLGNKADKTFVDSEIERLELKNKESLSDLKNKKAVVHFLNAKKVKIDGVDYGSIGDCQLITLPSGENILIDTFVPEKTKLIVVPYLKQLGISKLDYVFITHYHNDHAGGLYILADNFEIDMLVLPDEPNPNTEVISTGVMNTYNMVMNAITVHGLETTKPKEGDIIKIGDASFEILNLGINEYYYNTDIIENDFEYPGTQAYNNFSMFIYFKYGNTTIGFSADVSGSAQQRMLRDGVLKNCDIYTMEHHGINDYANKEYYKALNPSVVISQKWQSLNRGSEKWFKSNGVAIYHTLDEVTTIELDNFDYRIKNGKIDDNLKPNTDEFFQYNNVDKVGYVRKNDRGSYIVLDNDMIVAWKDIEFTNINVEVGKWLGERFKWEEEFPANIGTAIPIYMGGTGSFYSEDNFNGSSLDMSVKVGYEMKRGFRFYNDGLVFLDDDSLETNTAKSGKARVFFMGIYPKKHDEL